MSLRPLGCVAATVGAALLLGACSGRQESLPRPSRTYCEAAYRYENTIQKNPRPSIDKQITMVEKIAANAPKDIRADAQVFLHAMRRVKTDKSVVDNPKVRDAVTNVNRRTSAGCGFFKQDGDAGI